MKASSGRLLRGIMMSLILGLGVLALESRSQVFRRAYDHWVLDNREHYLPCGQWPNEGDVRELVSQHQAVIDQIKAVNPGLAGVEIDTSVCPGRADLVIWYGSHQDRLAIEKIIGGNTFYGAPYRLQNR